MSQHHDQSDDRQIILLDGGTGMALVKMGHSFINDHPLWSAAVVQTHPEDIVKLHKDFFHAGANIAVTSTYQASIEGYVKHLKISEMEARTLIQDSITLARKACDEASSITGFRGYVAASIGPYGATLNNMSEYHGRYAENMTIQELSSWHLDRMKIIVEAKPDLLAIETIPIVKEAVAITANLAHFPKMKAWVTFQCKDGEHTAHGEPISEAVQAVASNDSVIAVGVNCVNPEHVTSLVKSMAKMNLSIPIIVKPNGKHPLLSDQQKKEIAHKYLDEWVKEGATWIGGCCHIYPEDIAAIRSYLSEKSNLKFADPGKWFLS